MRIKTFPVYIQRSLILNKNTLQNKYTLVTKYYFSHIARDCQSLGDQKIVKKRQEDSRLTRGRAGCYDGKNVKEGGRMEVVLRKWEEGDVAYVQKRKQ